VRISIKREAAFFLSQYKKLAILPSLVLSIWGENLKRKLLRAHEILAISQISGTRIKGSNGLKP